MSLVCAAFESECIHSRTKKEAQDLIEEWNNTKLKIETQACQQWVTEVIKHMGVEKGKNYIKKYYPNFKGTLM